MKTLLVGKCAPERVYFMRDPGIAREVEFEAEVVAALSCAYPAYQCAIFEGTFQYGGERYQPDLALLARDFSHWFIVEVELVSHSFEKHVFPQARALALGDWQPDCISGLVNAFNISREHAGTLIRYVPHNVAVVANRRNDKWADILSGLGVQFLAITTYEANDGTRASELDGNLDITAASLGFGTYYATDRALRFHKRVPLGQAVPEDGDIMQLTDPDGVPGTWTIARSGDELWLIKEHGVLDLDDECTIQVVRTEGGAISIRHPR